MVSRSSNWEPIHLRTNEVINKKNHKIDGLREHLGKQRLQKEIDLFKQIEMNRVDNKTKHKKMSSSEWEKIYNKRFVKYLVDKQDNRQSFKGISL